MYKKERLTNCNASELSGFFRVLCKHINDMLVTINAGTASEANGSHTLNQTASPRRALVSCLTHRDSTLAGVSQR